VTASKQASANSDQKAQAETDVSCLVVPFLSEVHYESVVNAVENSSLIDVLRLQMLN
jgi:hypothetical protein